MKRRDCLNTTVGRVRKKTAGSIVFRDRRLFRPCLKPLEIMFLIPKRIFIYRFFYFAVPFICSTGLYAENPFIADPADLNNPDVADWIVHPEYDGDDAGVFYFRKRFALRSEPDSFVLHISADNRYKLYVNGSYIGFGPAVGDLHHWYYDTYRTVRSSAAGRQPDRRTGLEPGSAPGGAADQSAYGVDL
ncbi:MAG: hypothetical protein U5R06_21405 [candidate division KSB1 bacterium]|nr:hypothetical protein [candidate division KSB1 bacterium]